MQAKTLSAPMSAALATYYPQYKPFTPAWYAKHPNAWKLTHPYAPATAASLAAVLGVSAAALATQGTVAAGGTAPADTEAYEPDAQEAASLAEAGSGAQVDDQTEWMAIGVFGMTPNSQTKPTRMVQLAVSKEGVLRGSYCDMVGEAVQDVAGQVDKKSMRAAWRLGDEGQVTFEAPLGALTQPESAVAVHFANGSVEQWQLLQAANAE